MKKTVRNALRCLAGLLSLLFSVTAMTGCFDLGDYGTGSSDGDDFTAYYDAFGDVRAFWRGGERTYGIERSLFNKRTVNDLSWDTAEGDVPVEPLAYVYLAVPIRRDMTIGSLTLFFKPDEILSGPAGTPSAVTAGTLSLEIFLLAQNADMPSRMSYFDETAPAGEGDDTDPPEETPENPETPETPDDPDTLLAVATKSVTLAVGGWTDVTVDKWKTGDTDKGGYSGSLSVSEGNLILIRFKNNSGLNRGEELLPRIRFAFTNLMIYKQGEN